MSPCPRTNFPQQECSSGCADPQCSSGCADPQCSSGYADPQCSSGCADPQCSSGCADRQCSSGCADRQCSSGCADPQCSSGCADHDIPQHFSFGPETIPWTDSVDENETRLDGTRFVLVKKTGSEWEVLRWSKNICKMVDTRVYPWNPLTKECWVTYSSNFYNGKKEWKQIMIKAKLTVTKDSISITDKQELLPRHFNKKVEKNCLLESPHTSDTILYHVEQGIEVISDHASTTRVPSVVFQKLKDLYGKETILASLGTPPVLYTTKTKIMVAHLKMKILDSYPAGSPMETFRQQYFPSISSETKITLHNRFIYFMVIVEYDFSTLDIVRHSMAFIPSFQDNHIPYLLVFPMSIVPLVERDEFQIWYGEGDTRCKVLTLHRSTIESMLYSCYMDKDFDFNILHTSEGTQNIPVFQTFSKETNVVDYHRQQYPSLDFRFLDDASALSFLEHHFDEFIVNAFKKINPMFGASRADFFRYCVLYVYGGVYMDIKAGIQKDFTPLLKSDENVLIVGHWKVPCHTDLLKEPKGEFMNWVLLANKPENPLLAEIIVEMVRRIHNFKPKNTLLPATMNNPCSLSKYRVLVTTGPLMMSEVLLKHKDSPHLRILPEMESTFAYVSSQCTKMRHGEYAKVERSVPYILE